MEINITDREVLSRLGMDASLWATHFCEVYDNKHVEYDVVIGWFANAIMAGWDRGFARGATEERNNFATMLAQDMERIIRD